MENFVLTCFSIFFAFYGGLAFAEAGQGSSYLLASNSTICADGTSNCSQPNFKALVNTTTCMRQMNELIKTCREENASAVNSCDEKQDSGVMGTLRQASSVLGTVTAASVQASCSKMAALSQAANAALAAYQTNCSSSVGSCQSACSKVTSYWRSNNKCVEDAAFGPPPPAPPSDLYDEARDLLATCQDINKKADDAGKALQNYALTAANAQHCADDSSGVSTPSPDICKANPNIAGCTPTGPVDCTKPEMATNKVCICSKNPNDPSCIDAKSVANYENSGTTDAASRVPSTDASGLGDNYGLPGIEQGKINSSFADPTAEGKQGAGANLSQNSIGDGGVGGKSAAGGTGDKATQDVNAGFYGGGGSGNSYGGSSGDGGTGFSGAMEKVGAAIKKKSADLRQFLPGGSMDPKARGIAGASGPDGITGPNTNIWQKIQNRYQVVSPTLMP